MHDVLKSFKQKPVPKISQKLQNFLETPKFNKKSQKLGSKHEMHEKVKERRSYQKKKDQSRPKNPWEWSWSERELIGKRKRRFLSKEIEEKWRKHRADPLYRKPSFSMDREVSRIKTREIAIEQLSRICRKVSTVKGARWVEKLSRIQKLPRWIE